MSKIKRHPIICGMIILAIIVSSLFAVSVGMRSHHFGILNDEFHNHLTGSTIMFTNRWVEENPFSLGFKMYYFDKSIETPTTQEQYVYDSYPPGTIIPIYLICILSGQEPSAEIVMGYNLFGQFMIALLLALALFLLFNRAKINYVATLILSTVAASIILFMPANSYFMQAVFFSDQAVLLPLAMLLFTEVVRDLYYPARFKKLTDITQALILFYGVFTDWLFVFVCIALYLKRLVNKEIISDNTKKIKSFFTNSIRLAIPAIVAVVLYLIQVLTNDTDRFFKKMLERTGIDGNSWTDWFDHFVWGEHLTLGYGKIAKPLLITILVSLAVFVIWYIYSIVRDNKMSKAVTETNKGKKKSVSVPVYEKPIELRFLINMFFILTAACYMQLYAFKQHSAIHHFSVLKLSLVMAVGSVSVPVIYYLIIKDLLKNFAKINVKKFVNTTVSLLIAVVMLFTIGTYLVDEAPRFEELFARSPYAPEFEIYGSFISDNLEYNDVVFSPHLSAHSEQHARLCWTKRIVRQADSTEAIRSNMYRFGPEANALLFIANQNYIPIELESFILNADLVAQSGNMQIYRMNNLTLDQIQ